MFRNYLVTAIRNFGRHKLYSFINIAGLTIGMTCSIFIILFVRDELSYDKWIPDTSNLYRLESTINNPGQTPLRTSYSPFPIPQAMLDQIPDVKAMTRLSPEQMAVVIGDSQFNEKVDVVDPNFFQVIKLPLIEGSPAGVFVQPESVVLSQSTATKYFGSAEPLNKSITITATSCDPESGNCQTVQKSLIVTGVMRDLPHNTQLVADLLIPNTSSTDQYPQSEKVVWVDVGGWGYVDLAPNADPNLVLAKLKSIIDVSVDPKKYGYGNIRASDLLQMHLTRFQDDHLSTDQYGSMTAPGSWTTVYGFAVIGLLILMVACFNFTNLATARATLRAREISLRKCVGATQKQLIVQFLGESLLMAFASLILALALVESLLPLYDSFLAKPIQFHYLEDWRLLLGFVAIAIVAGLLSGVYPALVLSRFRPAAVLRTNAAKQTGSGLLRMSLVVLQFAVSIGLGIAAVVVFAQISFARNIDLGFHREGVLIVDGTHLAPTARQSFADALRANPDIKAVAISNSVPFDGARVNAVVHIPGLSDEYVRINSMSPDYPELYGEQLLAGRFLSNSRGEDEFSKAGTPYNILINATAARRFGYDVGQAVGKTVVLGTTSVKIVGVLADTKVDGAREPVAAAVFRYIPARSSTFSVLARAGRIDGAISDVNKTWRSFAPTFAVQWHFLSEDFNKLFQSDEKEGEIFGVFVGIAILIACLGLFGLAAFTAERRTKEIGIRKVFGARTRDIVLLLLWQFSIPVFLANLIAWPLAYYYLHNWLQGYAYRIGLNPLYFAGAGAVALIIAWATIFAHAHRVARANPINALRHE